jgi:hypothetical protein
MIRLDPAKIIIRRDPSIASADVLLERLQAGNKAFAALAKAIDGMDPPAAKEPLTPAVEPRS